MLASNKILLTVIGAALFVSTALIQVRADSIVGTGWTGKGANNNWTTSGNWDNTPPSTGGSGDRNLFYGQGYFNAGNNGFTTSNNNLSSWDGYRITFQDITSQPDVSFTITGNSFTLFDFGGNFPKIENLSNVTQTFTLTSGNTITLSGNATGKAEVNPVRGNLVFSAGTKIALNSPMDVYGNNTGATFTATFNDVISGAHAITLYNNSTVALNAANTYTGDTNIKNGTLLVGANAPSGSAGALGNSTNAVTLGDTTGTGSASLLTNGAFTVGRDVTVPSGSAGAMFIGGNTAAASTYSGKITLGTASGTARNVVLVAATGGSVNFTGEINENASVPNSQVQINSSGSGVFNGTVRLSNTNNSYGGQTLLSAGVLEVTALDNGSSNSSIGNASTTASNLFLNGTLRYIGGGASSTNRAFAFGTVGATIDAAAPVSFTGTGGLSAVLTGNRTLTLTGSSNGSLANNIPNPSSGTTAVTKSGAGTWTLSGATSTYSGGTNVNGGTLALGSSGAIGSSGTISFGGGTLQFSASNTTDYSARFSNAASQAYSLDTNGQSVTLASNLTSSGGTLTKLGAGTLTLSGTNSYSGGTTVSAGTLQGTTSSVQGNITNNSSVTFNQSTDGTYNGTMSGSGSLTKTGTGMVVLAANSNSYGGGTTVNGGNLRTNNTSGSATGSGNVVVNEDGTLSGTGSVAGSVTINTGGTLSPGASIESLDIGTSVANFLTLNGTFDYEIDSSSSANNFYAAADLVNVTGDLNLSGATLTLTDLASPSLILPEGTKFTLISYAGAWNNGTFNSHPDDSLVTVGANTFVLNYNDTSRGQNFSDQTPSGLSYVTLSVAAVPEASVVVFATLVCAIGGLHYGRQKLLRRARRSNL